MARRADVAGQVGQVDMRDVERMGYALAIVPGLLMKTVVGACDAVLQQLKEQAKRDGRMVATGTKAGPGAATGQVVLFAQDAQNLSHRPRLGDAAAGFVGHVAVENLRNCP